MPPQTPLHKPQSKADAGAPAWGLVCLTSDDTIRFRTITRTRFLALPEPEQEARLRALYEHNMTVLFRALEFCHDQGIRLYRATSSLFPQVDHPVGQQVLARLAPQMKPFGGRAQRLGVRVVLHPDQYVVLNSESSVVAAQSAAIMEQHARVFDLLSLPRSPWSAMILHGGKSGRPQALVEAIKVLSPGVRRRLVLENDERCYGAAEIIQICREALVPMVFDNHHHVVREKLSSYRHPSLARFVRLARETWPRPEWQIVHLSNGREFFGDPRHSDLITEVPPSFHRCPWIEVEAKLKEQAIRELQA